MITHAIRYVGPGHENQVMYVCPDNELMPQSQSGYLYCCGCKETLQFKTEVGAQKFMDAHGLNNGRHKIVDSDTARKEKQSKKKKVVSALTGKIIKE